MLWCLLEIWCLWIWKFCCLDLIYTRASQLVMITVLWLRRCYRWRMFPTLQQVYMVISEILITLCWLPCTLCVSFFQSAELMSLTISGQLIELYFRFRYCGVVFCCNTIMVFVSGKYHGARPMETKIFLALLNGLQYYAPLQMLGP
jgi:hypothetical protein